MCRSKNTESGQPEGVRILIEVGQDRSHCGRHRWGELNWEVGYQRPSDNAEGRDKGSLECFCVGKYGSYLFLLLIILL